MTPAQAVADVQQYKRALAAELNRATDYERKVRQAAERIRAGEERYARVRAECRAEYARQFERMYGEPMEGTSRLRPARVR